MVGKYKVITLCGSTRFKDAFMKAQKRLTLEGNIVISVGLFGHSGDDEVWEGMSEDTMSKTKEMLDEMHKRKIDMADEIFVINVGGYIGSSTRSEIEYAKATGKPIHYLEPTAIDALIIDFVIMHCSCSASRNLSMPSFRMSRRFFPGDSYRGFQSHKAVHAMLLVDSR